MAKRNFGIGDDNRDGVDDDIDRRPGNTGASPAYSQMYDSLNQQEYSNLSEVPNHIEAILAAQDRQEALKEAQKSAQELQNRVQFWPSVGKFIIPRENTWAAHAEIVGNPDCSLDFNPSKYVYFDRIIAEHTGDWIMRPEYQALRTNLEVLRNDTIGMYMHDGSFDPGDEVHLSSLVGIAEEIGKRLRFCPAKDDGLLTRVGKAIARLFIPTFEIGIVNAEGVGAREIYKHLLSVQEIPGRGGQVDAKLKSYLGIPPRAWELPPLEQTPFSDAGMIAPPIRPAECAPVADAHSRYKSHVERYVNESAKAALAAVRG